jgi:hypothetical protein
MDDITPYLDPLRIMQAGVEWERAKGQLRAFLAVQSTKRMFLPPGADVPIMEDGPNILCIVCGAICNHMTLRCAKHRQADWDEGPGPTNADMEYLKWKQNRDAERARSQPTE